MNRLQTRYKEEIAPKLKEELGIANVMALPRIEKVVISIAAGDVKDNAGSLEKLMVNLGALAGQKPVVTKAKQSVSNFKVAKGQSIGAMVTLRGVRMYEFLDKLISVVLPKVRDFRGVSNTAFDAQGNYSLGLREQIIFPEVDYRTVDKTRGMAITIVTTAKNKENGRRLLELFGMPFRKGQNGEN